MSDVVARVVEHLEGLAMFTPWLVWFSRELIVYLANGTTKLSSLTGLLLTIAVLMENGADRVDSIFDLLMTFETCLSLILVLLTLVKIMGQPNYAKRDITLISIVIFVSWLVALGLNMTLFVAIAFGISLGLLSVVGIKSVGQSDRSRR